jgi:autoinducer 2-degrading protein
MPRIGIIVEFTIKPGNWAAFNAHIRDHAAKTLAEEAGCERFDVLQPLDADGKHDEGRIMLCEIYRDHAAFDTHRNNPRMPGVGATSKPMLDHRVLTVCELD